MNHRCPHRCASLFYGRNEDGGICCVYHGGKFDPDGNCVDMPNLPADQDFRQKVKAKSYRVAERPGLIWVYMGARAEPPPMPMIEATLLDESELQPMLAQRACNWLQGLEGDIDTSHFGFLHVGSVRPDQVSPDNLLRYQVICPPAPTGMAAGDRPPTRPTTTASTATPSATTSSTPASATSTCRTRPSPKAWAQSSTTASSISRPATR